MPLSLNIAKITPPRFPHILYRQRLVDRLEQHRDKKIILILGPGAQGKSTLALSYVMTSGRPSAWVNLGPEESDPVNLFYLLGQSLQQALPEVDLTAALQSPALSFGPREELHLYRDWSLALLDRLRLPVQVILDGLDRLSTEAPSYRFIQVLLDCLPPPVHLFMLSREMPPLEIQALKMRQEAFILTAEDLAFTREETRRYLRELRQMSLPAELLDRFQQLTEGWVGGLVLLSESLERVPETLREKHLAGGFPERFKEEIFRYFGECIFATRSPQDQDFLLKSSILEVVDPDFVQGFLGLPHPREILEDLVQRNLFTQAIHDPQKGWLFRYHQLFRSCLQRRFEASLSRADRKALYLKVASLFEQKGEPEEALKFCLKAQAFVDAAALLEKIGMDLLSLGRTGDLGRWLDALPADLIQENPWLLFYRYMSRRLQGSPESLQQAFSLFDQRGDLRGVLLSLAYLLEVAVYYLSFSGDIEPLLARAEAVLASQESSSYPHEQAALWFQLGIANTIRYGDPRQALWACRKAYLLARDLGDLPLQVGALEQAYFAHTILGEFSQAGEIMAQVDDLIKDLGIPQLLGMHLYFQTYFWLFQGEFQRAETLNRMTMEEIQRHGLRHLLPVTLIQQFMVSFYQGNFSEADAVVQPLLAEAAVMSNRFLYGLVLHIVGMSFYQRGEYRRAHEHGQEAMPYFTLEINYRALNKLLLGQAAYHLGEIDTEIEQKLKEALDYFERLSYVNFTTETHFALALMHWSRKRQKEAARHLETGMGIAWERSLYHFFYLNQEDLIKVCCLALELEVPGTWGYVARFLASDRLAPLAGPELARLSRHPKARVAEKAWEILLAIRRAGRPRLRLQTLGSFQVRRGEDLLPDRAWEGPLSRLLLKALIVRGGQGVPKDVIMEDLWPEAAPAEAENKFKSCLHRLRKALEPDLDRAVGSCYVHLEANLLSLDKELVQVDVDDLAALAAMGKKQEAAGKLKEAIAFFQEAASLYAGDFLPEELYHPWVERQREAFRGLYLEVLERLAELWEKQGSLRRAVQCWQQAHRADPLEPHAVQRLMLLNDRLGRPQVALRVFKEYREALKRELDATPDDTTTAICLKIKERF